MEAHLTSRCCLALALEKMWSVTGSSLGQGCKCAPIIYNLLVLTTALSQKAGSLRATVKKKCDWPSFPLEMVHSGVQFPDSPLLGGPALGGLWASPQSF